MGFQKKKKKGRSRRRCGPVNPGADVGRSRLDVGRSIPAQMWAGPGSDVGRSDRDRQDRRGCECACLCARVPMQARGCVGGWACTAFLISKFAFLTSETGFGFDTPWSTTFFATISPCHAHVCMPSVRTPVCAEMLSHKMRARARTKYVGRTLHRLNSTCLCVRA